jgi:hypothetical protein
MSTDFPVERDAFNLFLDERFVGGSGDATLEDALAEFRAYQSDLERLKQKLKPSIEQANRGEAQPLDLDAVLQRVRERTAQQGTR